MPDSGQLDAVLAAVKAWPDDAAARVTADATASLDGVSARRPRIGRSGRRNGLEVEQRNGKKWPVSLFDLKNPFLRPDP